MLYRRKTMSMTTRGIVNSSEKRSDDHGFCGAGIVETEGKGTPSVDSGASTQSPAGLKQSKPVAKVATFGGAESTISSSK
jgi:hypothetical protein